MFNNLNNGNNSNQFAVDDIFAETDKPSTTSMPNNIETHKVGLTANGENLNVLKEADNISEVAPDKKNYLRLLIIVVLVIALLGGAYFVYSQFFAGENIEVVEEPTPQITKEERPQPVTPAVKDDEFVPIIPGVDLNPAGTSTIGESPTSSSLEEGNVASSSNPEVIQETIDSDNDGLSDSEEIAARTNINVIDTDNDGLSDYEELKIYLTSPLIADTDDDGYLDGAEIKSGYDPRVKGAKLPGNN